MEDRWAVALAASVALGALRPSPVPLVVGAVLAGLGAARRRPLLLCLGAALLASALAQRSLDGLEGLRPGPVQGEVTLLTDPELRGGRVVAEVRRGRAHLQLEAARTVAGDLVDHLAGERLVVWGEAAPMAHPGAWTRSRHLAGRLRVLRWSPGRPPAAPAAAANAVRRALSRGAAGLSRRDASLFAGLVVGDDRAQPPELTDDFEGAGLTHLLAVSGENVAFVLVLARPVARRLRIWPRLGLTLAAIAGFALLTRFEPSVTRAAAMAALGAAAVTVGRPAGRVRTLALAAAGLLLVDPLLVGSLGFRLSVAAALAITLAAGALARALPGPRWVAEPLAVTLAAQLGVAPLLLAAFGPLPVASVPANLLAVPAAGAVMVWGMTAGVAAGLLPATWAAALHAPTRLLLWWIAGVAHRAAAAPLGQVGVVGTVAVALGLALRAVASAPRLGALGGRGDVVVPRTRGAGAAEARLGALGGRGDVVVPRTRGAEARLGALGGRDDVVVPRTRGARAARRVGTGLLVVAVGVALLGAQAAPALRTTLAPGIVRWHGAGTDVVVLGGGSWRSSIGPDEALAALRTAGVGAIDVLVASDGHASAAAIDAIGRRHPIGRVLVPPGGPPADRLSGAIAVPRSGAALAVGGLDLLLTPVEDRLVVEAWPARR